MISVMYAAQKYIVTNLTKKCTKFLEENLSARTAPMILEQSVMYNEKDLKTKVLQKIEQEAPDVLSSEDFVKLSKEALHEVLQLNLRISNEMEVFQASIYWAKNKCQELTKPIEGTNLREALGDNLFLIRFPTMSPTDISDTVIPQNVLTASEGLQILCYITAEKHKPDHLPFSTEPRYQPLPTPTPPTHHVDQTPRSPLIPGPYHCHSGNIYNGRAISKSTALNCTVSRPVRIKKIFIHLNYKNILYLNSKLTVLLTQNGSTLLEYNGFPVIITKSAGQPEHGAVEGKNVRVETGNLLLEIKLEVRNACGRSAAFSFRTSGLATSELSDQFVTITFAPVHENLLLGIEYQLV